MKNAKKIRAKLVPHRMCNMFICDFYYKYWIHICSEIQLPSFEVFYIINMIIILFLTGRAGKMTEVKESSRQVVVWGKFLLFFSAYFYRVGVLENCSRQSCKVVEFKEGTKNIILVRILNVIHSVTVLPHHGKIYFSTKPQHIAVTIGMCLQLCMLRPTTLKTQHERA